MKNHLDSKSPNELRMFKLKPLSAGIRLAVASSFLLGYQPTAIAQLPVPANVWATLGSASKQYQGKTLNITQHTDRAILNWESFNVGAKNQVNFKQPGASSIALNRILQGNPSQILGKVNANGQIYLYNKNGFVFGKESTVNANTVVASALDITDKVLESGGIVNEFNQNRGAALEGTPDKSAAVIVERGAKINVGANGRMILAAPEVKNSGELKADKFGQIIMVGSKDKVYLQPADADSRFAGLLVEVGTGGKVSNFGNVLARQGNVTLAGFAVNQGGRVSATTSVNVNGSIRLLAREGQGLAGDKLVGTSTIRDQDADDGLGTKAKLTFERGSVTEVVADNDGGKAIDEQQQPESYLEASGHKIHFKSGSAIGVPGGKVDITATDNLLTPNQGTSGRIILEAGAHIDVSGTKNISVPVERNAVEVPVQSFELRDSPYQKGGVLQGTTVNIDSRKKTPIIDASGALARIERSIGERLGKGGKVNMTSGGDVIVNPGAKINISGGSINYKSGFVKTTKLMTDYGEFVDISDADPTQTYRAVLGKYVERNEKWGTEKVFQTDGFLGKGVFEPGYIQGLDAGTLTILTPNLAFNGALVAGAASGLYQRDPASQAFGGEFAIDAKVFNSFQDVIIKAGKAGSAIKEDDDFPEKDDKPAPLILTSGMINKSGLEKFSVKTLGNGQINKDTHIAMDPGSTFSLVAGDINVEGSFYSSGGTFRLGSGVDLDDTSSQRLFDPTAQLTFAKNSTIDVSGRWINDFANGLDKTPSEDIAKDGGNITLAAAGDVTLRKNSRLNADGGAWLAQGRTFSPGQAGNISIAAEGNGSEPSKIQINGQLSAYGVEKGGGLTLSSGEIIVGKHIATDNENPAALILPVNQGKLGISGVNGFSSIRLDANFGKLTFADNTALKLRQVNPLLAEDYVNRQSNASLQSLSTLAELPDHLRKPVDFILSGEQGITINKGTRIIADPKAQISMDSTQGGIYVDGLISTPGGAIDLAINATPTTFNPTQAIWLGKHATLDASGVTVFDPLDGLNRRNGEVLDGGKIALTAERGYIIQEEGSSIKANGTRATLDIVTNDTKITKPTVIESSGGTISLTSTEGGILDGGLQATAGGNSSQGGKLSLTLDRSIRRPQQEDIDDFPFGEIAINVKQEQERILDDSIKFGDDLGGLDRNGQFDVGANQIQTAGFDHVRIATVNVNNDGTSSEQSAVTFIGDVDLSLGGSIDIDAPLIRWEPMGKSESGHVNLNSSFFRAGSSLIRQTQDNPIAGNGHLAVNSKWLEFRGASRWDGFDKLRFKSTHDMRTKGVLRIDTDVDGKQNSDYVGELVTQGDLILTASQIYPVTLSKFTFAVEGNNQGKITINNSQKTDATPLTAAGALTFNAPKIQQNGTLKAPFGTISLNATQSLKFGNQSLTSVSGNGLRIPFGKTFSGLDWLYPLEANNIINLSRPPEKKLILSAPKIDMTKGSSFDMSGGGDLLAYEFQPGIGGSFDYLSEGSPSYGGGFAILPNLKSELSPFDPIQSAGFEESVGSQIYLSGSKQLTEGFYTLLPAKYALLPGAFLITPQEGTTDQRINTVNPSGLSTVSGYRFDASTGTRDARWQGFLVESGADVRKNAQYDEQGANNFFTQQALKNSVPIPILPRDSGQMVIRDVESQLVLNGDIKSSSSGGRGARLDIAANKLKIVDTFSTLPTEGELEVLASNLTDLAVDSLLLGGERNLDNNTGETNIDVSSQSVVFAKNAKVDATDLMAVATDNVSLEQGASISAGGKVNTGDTIINVKGDGAFLRVSADKQINLNRIDAPGLKGDLLLSEGASLDASESMLIDASHRTTLDGNLNMQDGSLNLSANKINIGENFNDNDGGALNLTRRDLQALDVSELILNSRDTIDFYGSADQNLSLAFDNLTLNAAGISGQGKGFEVNLTANDLLVSNSNNVKASSTGKGDGILSIETQNYKQGDGKFGIDGFRTVEINAKDAFIASGDGQLKTASDLNMKAGYFGTEGGKQLSIDASGHRLRAERYMTNTLTPSVRGLGGGIDLLADAIDFNARATLPSGNLSLTALKGDVELGSSTDIDLSGNAIRFADAVRYTSGGSLNVLAEQGDISMAKGALIDLASGGGKASAGELSLSAAKGGVDLLGAIKAPGGSASIDVGAFDQISDFDNLADQLMVSGITQDLRIRSRDGDIVQQKGHTITARNITLTADKGGINLSGKLNADHAERGGNIKLFADDKIVLQENAVLSAKGSNSQSRGGSVLLSSTDNDSSDHISGISVHKNAIPVSNGRKASQEIAKIDVSGGNQGQGGTVTFRALRTDSNNDGFDDDVAIEPIAGTVVGADKFYAEGVKKYSNADFGTLGTLEFFDIERIKNDTDIFMTAANMQQVSKRLGRDIQLRPGVEINYTGDLTLKSEWKLVDWHYSDGTDKAPVAGGLAINASGNLKFEKSLTDGFRTDFNFLGVAKDFLQKDDSWYYQLTAGADLSSAENGITSQAAKTLTVATNPDAFPDFPDPFSNHDTVIRTGTGNIDLNASGNINFEDRTAVYVAGKANKDKPYGTFGEQYVNFILFADYPTGGGDLTINAGGDINGSLSQGAFINDWLVKQGNDWALNPTNKQSTAWGIDFVKFNQNLGSFGGGDILVNAKRDINDLGVVVPTTGKQIGKLSDPSNEFSAPLTNEVEINGGGNMSVNSDGNINGGLYYVARGEGNLNAGGAIQGSSQPVEFDPSLKGLLNGPQLLLGDTQFNLAATKSVGIDAVTDPFILGIDFSESLDDTNFFSYSADSALSLTSLSGDIKLDADPGVILGSSFNFSGGQTALAKIMPATLRASAYGGSVLVEGKDTDLFLFPSVKGQLELFAKQDIFFETGGIKRVGMSDYDPNLLPDLFTPSNAVNLTSDDNNIAAALSPFTNNSSVHAQDPLHRNDLEPVRLVTQEGDIKGIQFNLAKKAFVQSGRDINNASFQIQHARDQGDVSIISANRDIVYVTERNPDFGTLNTNTNRIEVGGPGDVLIKSGRNIDLGTSVGISTIGNTVNTNLPDTGANVTLLVGLNGGQPKYLGLQQLNTDVLKYAENYDKYQQLVTEFMRKRTNNPNMTTKTAFEQFNKLEPSQYLELQGKFTGLESPKYSNLLNEMKRDITQFVRTAINQPDLTEKAALERFTKMTPDEYTAIQPKLNKLANEILFSELNETGSASAADPTLGNERGFNAIKALYPGNAWQGDLSLFFSKLQTVKGGDINMLVPGGNINAGLAVVANDLRKDASELGIVAQGVGDINAFLQDDFIVNQSRVFALGGGDIMIWSSEGNIDAGRGAKSAIAAPPPIISFDEVGNLVITFPPVVSGSGIRTAAPLDQDVKPGNVALYAPGGIVNAGEAGIAGNNVTISATAVLGANNIQVGGVSSGVPAAATGSLAAGLSGVSNVAANVSQVAEASTGFSNKNSDDGRNKKPSKLRSVVVKLLGFGA